MEAILNTNECFVIGAWTDTREKERNLINVIKELKSKDYPVCLVTHCPVSKDLQELVDYFIYEKENVLSDNWKLNFWRINNGVREEKISDVDYHGVACLMNIRNAIDLLNAKDKFKYIHYREADLIYDFDKYMNIFKTEMLSNDKLALFIHYQDENYRTDLFSVDISWYDAAIPRAQSWEEYKNIENPNLILEYWFTHQVQEYMKVFNETFKFEIDNRDMIVFVKDFQIGNKWTQSMANVDWSKDLRPPLDFSDAPSVMSASSRKESFMKVLELLYKRRKENLQIVEVGVTRVLGHVPDGDSTSVWAWFISKYGGSYHGCDISKDNLNVAAIALKKYITGSDRSNTVVLTASDGVEFLNKYDKPIDLLYLDSIDWVKDSWESGLFHMQLLLVAMNKVTIGGYIMFDDIINADTFEGKACLAVPYLLGGNNFTCVFRGYQYIFRRDI